jgi:hypothetical protein
MVRGLSALPSAVQQVNASLAKIPCCTHRPSSVVIHHRMASQKY